MLEIVEIGISSLHPNRFFKPLSSLLSYTSRNNSSQWIIVILIQWVTGVGCISYGSPIFTLQFLCLTLHLVGGAGDLGELILISGALFRWCFGLHWVTHSLTVAIDGEMDCSIFRTFGSDFLLDLIINSGLENVINLWNWTWTFEIVWVILINWICLYMVDLSLDVLLPLVLDINAILYLLLVPLFQELGMILRVALNHPPISCSPGHDLLLHLLLETFHCIWILICLLWNCLSIPSLWSRWVFLFQKVFLE